MLQLSVSVMLYEREQACSCLKNAAAARVLEIWPGLRHKKGWQLGGLVRMQVWQLQQPGKRQERAEIF